MVCAKDSRIKVEIPSWLKVFECKNFFIMCEEIDAEGKIISDHCSQLEVFVEGDQLLWIEPSKGWVGRVKITLEAVNRVGDVDQTTFDVDVIEIDYNDCNFLKQQCFCQAKSETFLSASTLKKECYTEPQPFMVHDQYFRFWLIDERGKKNEVIWLDWTE